MNQEKTLTPEERKAMYMDVDKEELVDMMIQLENTLSLLINKDYNKVYVPCGKCGRALEWGSVNIEGK